MSHGQPQPWIDASEPLDSVLELIMIWAKQEIAGALEAAINALEVEQEAETKEGLHLQLSCSQALVACLQR